jgi:hypothetical protein
MRIKSINSIQVGNDLIAPGEVFEAPYNVAVELVERGAAVEVDDEVTVEVKLQGDQPKPGKAKGKGE